MGRIAVTDGMAPQAVSRLTEAGHEVVEGSIDSKLLESGALSGFDAIIIRSATILNASVIDSSKGLKVIGRAGVGVDNIDLDAATANGIIVVNAPRASTQSVVELTIAHLLSSVRKVAVSDRGLREGKWEKKLMKGTELSGKALGFIGFGRIAQGVADVAVALGMEIHAYDPYLPVKVSRGLGVRMHADVDDLFRMCTHITVHCNLTEETHHLVNADRLALMTGRGADGVHCGNHLVNCARGGIIDEEAAFTALEDGTLSTLALDVFENEPVEADHPLLQHPGFHGTPHVGAATLEAQVRVGLDIADAVDTVLKGREADTQVNR
jgi:D-3-phosphoglycerate dehydrogenase